MFRPSGLNPVFRLYSGGSGYRTAMVKHTRDMFIAFLAIALTVPALPVLAAGDSAQMHFTESQRQAHPFSHYAQQRESRRPISASQAKSIAKSHLPGARFINVRRAGDTYIVRMQQKNGRILDVYIDARTGRVRNKPL